MKASIVIPNWNGEDKLRRNLPKVLKVKGISEVVVVDDASSDNSVEVLEKQFPQIKLIKKNANSGFADTVNLGFKNTESELVFLLNSDATPQPDALENASPHFKDSKIFSVGCNAGGGWSWARFENGFFWHFATESKDISHQTLWASGGSGIFKKSIWDNLGGFDLLYKPFYEEDVDLGYRATKRGYINIWESTSKVEHYQEPGVISQHFSKEYISRTAQRNQLIFIWKNITSNKLTKAHQISLAKKLIVVPKYWPTFLKAIARMPEILVKRDIEKKESKLSDEEILKKFTL